jgi:hypothetical protein
VKLYCSTRRGTIPFHSIPLFAQRQFPMQRRTTTGHPASSRPPQSSAASLTGDRITNALGGRRSSSSKRKKSSPVILIILLAATILVVSWYFFPAQVLLAEQEAELVTHELAQKAILAEHKVEDWIHEPQQQQRPVAALDRSASEAATARMMAQSSNWVDGEKALKRQLAKLSERQQKGELLGVPVLTRYLGEDFPAWVEPGKTNDDGAEWKRKVDAKYAEMRTQEEEWKKQMQEIIDQRERDIGITTPR